MGVLQEEYTVIQDVITQLNALIGDDQVLGCNVFDSLHHVVFNGYVYRTITELEVESREWGCENQWTEMPDGWEAAPYADDILSNVVRPYPWSTHLLCFTDRPNNNYHTSAWGEDKTYGRVEADGNKYCMLFLSMYFGEEWSVWK